MFEGSMLLVVLNGNNHIHFFFIWGGISSAIWSDMFYISAIKLNFQPYIQQYTSLNDNFQYNYPPSTYLVWRLVVRDLLSHSRAQQNSCLHSPHILRMSRGTAWSHNPTAWRYHLYYRKLCYGPALQYLCPVYLKMEKSQIYIYIYIYIYKCWKFARQKNKCVSGNGSENF